MKRFFAMFIAFAVCMPLLFACSDNETETTSADVPSANISYDAVSYFVPGGEDTSDDHEESTAVSGSGSETDRTGGFVIKVAKYDYNNELEKKFDIFHSGVYENVSIAILDVTNESDKNYSITINGSYIDKNGNVIKTETQEWDQLASGSQKYFLFRPETEFERFEYTVETKEYKGECWKNNITFTFLNLMKINELAYPSTIGHGVKRVEALMGNISCAFNVSKQFSIGFQYLVLFDANGKVIGVYRSGSTDFMQPGKHDSTSAFTIYFADPDNGGKLGEWPECFRGNVTGIIVVSWLDEVGKLADHMDLLQ